jgi:hypothetical protein
MCDPAALDVATDLTAYDVRCATEAAVPRVENGSASMKRIVQFVRFRERWTWTLRRIEKEVLKLSEQRH